MLFFQAQTGQGQSAKVDVATGTTDNLTFTIADMNVIDPTGDVETKNIVDTHNRSDEAENAELVINANVNNFGPTNTSLGDGVEATAKLVANDNTKTAEAKYNVYLVLDQNELEYTTDSKPELILTVHEPGKNNTEYTSIVTPLDHHTKDTDNGRDIAGYDITGQRAVITIAEDYLINVTEESKDLTEIQTWKVQVTLVNLNEDQNNNTGKSVTGRVIITTEKDIKLSNINTLDIVRTGETIKATAVTEDTDNITEYYFKIDGGGTQ